jgi:hypothetical protein
LAGREAVDIGMIKREGSGDSISSWNDNWIPKQQSMKPMGRRMDTDLEKVSYMITDDYRWMTEVIEDLFFAPDAEAILKIPLRQSWGADWIAWSKENSGIYSVRSAYRALMEQREMTQIISNGGCASTSDNDDDIWSRL